MPMSRSAKGWILATLGLLLLLLLYHLRAVFLPLLVALLAAYVLNPLLGLLEKKGVPRTVSIAGLYAILLGLLATVLFWALPALVGQTGDLIEETFIGEDAKIHALADRADARLRGWLGEENWKRVRAGLKGEKLEAVATRAASGATELALGALGGLFGVVSFVALVPVYLFFLMKNLNGWWERFTHLIPRAYRDRTLSTLGRIHRANAAFFRGQATISLIDGLILGIGLVIAGVKFSFLFGVLYAFASVIPYLGPTLMFAAVEVVVLAETGRLGGSFYAVAGLFALIQVLEGAVLQPLIMGRETGLHPMQIILGLLIFGKLFGFVGILIGVPLAATAKILVEDYVWPLFEDVADLTRVRVKPDQS
jgi:predicted PurR-regulated permease PerM